MNTFYFPFVVISYYNKWEVECAELVGLLLLSEVSKIDRLNVGLYRDDGLAVSGASRRQNENMSKQIAKIFENFNLKITSEENSKRVDFLDMIFDLDDESYEPYNKPGNIPQYVHRLSNHPPAIIKNIPTNVNKRLSSISSSEKLFQKAAPLFQEAIEKSGYDFKLTYQPQPDNQAPKKQKRKRPALWFNPPYNATVKTNIGRDFLRLIDECFPPSNTLHKIFNRQTVKVSYSTTPNMAQTIAAKNAKILKEEGEAKRECNCPKTKICPLNKKCLVDNIIYQATVTSQNQESKTYIGLTSTDFKARLGTHTQSFKDPNVNQTSLSKHIHDQKLKGIQPTVTWKIIDRGKPYSPVHGVCNLCLKEKFYITYKPEMAELNSRSEIFSHCVHKKSALLIKKDRKKKKSPGN